MLSVGQVTSDRLDRVEDIIDADKDADRYTFDIKVLLDGAEIQPDTAYGDVSIKFRMERIPQNAAVEVYHIDDAITSAEKMEAVVGERTISVNTEHFSIFTVEFIYGDREFVLTGMESIKLSELLEAVGLSGVVENAFSGNESLFTVTRDENGEWIVTSLMAFSSNETLTVVIDGIEYIILVTDAVTEEAGWQNDGGDWEYATLREAVDRVPEGGTVYVFNDVSATSAIVIRKSLTIEGSGTDRTITRAPGSSYVVSVGSGCSLTLENITIDGAYSSGLTGGPLVHLNNDSALTINNGTVLKNNYTEQAGGAVSSQETAI